MMNKNQDILALFEANERKQKQLSTIIVILFTILSIVILLAGFYISNQHKTIINVKSKNDSLNVVVFTKDSFSRIMQDELSLCNSSIAGIIDSFDKVQSEILDYQRDLLRGNVMVQSTPPPLLDKSTKPATSKSDKNSVSNTETIMLDAAPMLSNYSVIIQYNSKFKSKIQELVRGLKEKGFTVPDAELINRFEYTSTIRYFKNEDEAIANEIAKIAQQQTGIKFKVQYVNMKVVHNQLEIWIGTL